MLDLLELKSLWFVLGALVSLILTASIASCPPPVKTNPQLSPHGVEL